MRRLMMLLGVIVLSFTLGTLPTKAAGSFTFTTIDFPGAIHTWAIGIDNLGNVVGSYLDATGLHGFLFDGSFSTIDFPDNLTEIRAINSFGEIVGPRGVTAFDDHGFWAVPHYGPTDFTPIDFPDANRSQANGINNARRVVGGYQNTVSFRFHSFIADPPYGPTNFTSFEVSLPGAKGNGASRINDAGQITGGFFDGTRDHGYFENGRAFSQIDFPRAINTRAIGINSLGQITGLYQDASSKVHGFLRTTEGFQTIDFPGATLDTIWRDRTGTYGINDDGQIVGAYMDASEYVHGYLATPVVQPGKPRPRR